MAKEVGSIRMGNPLALAVVGELATRAETRRRTADAKRLQWFERETTSDNREFADIVAAGENWVQFKGSAYGVVATTVVPYGAHELKSMLRVEPLQMSAGPWGPCAVGVRLVDAEGNVHATEMRVV